MENKLYVGNLSYSVRDDDLQQEMSAFGSVQSANVKSVQAAASVVAMAVATVVAVAATKL